MGLWLKSQHELNESLWPSCLFEQDGTNSDDEWKSAGVTTGGSIILAGYTDGGWVKSEEGESDFAAMSLDPGGRTLWSYQVSGLHRVEPALGGGYKLCRNTRPTHNTSESALTLGFDSSWTFPQK